MILPLALAITISVDNIAIDVPSYSKNRWQNNETILLHNHYQYTTRDINPDPYTYIKTQTSDILYNEISKELLQDEEENKR